MKPNFYNELIECVASYNTIFKIMQSETSAESKLERIQNVINATEPELKEILKMR